MREADIHRNNIPQEFRTEKECGRGQKRLAIMKCEILDARRPTTLFKKDPTQAFSMVWAIATSASFPKYCWIDLQ
jgi:hypothetical protein